MPVVYRRSNAQLGSVAGVGTSRYLNVTTAAAVILELGSANQAFTLFNIGSGNLLWGGSDIAVNSSNILFVSAGRTFEGLQDSFQVFLRAESVSTLISITEYRV